MPDNYASISYDESLGKYIYQPERKSYIAANFLFEDITKRAPRVVRLSKGEGNANYSEASQGIG